MPTSKNNKMNSKILIIADELRQHFLGPSAASNISIFLCGGAERAQGEFRRKLGAAIGALKSKYRYSIYYPEDMFVELVLGHQKHDLLTLENQLADSVSAIAILLQGAGTIAELGAFSNHPKLKDKLVVIVEPRHRKSPSFINNGPIRYLHKETSSKILYSDMIDSSMDYLVKSVSEASRKIAETHPHNRDLTNPIVCYEFYLALLYVLDPIPRYAFQKIAVELEPSFPDSAIIGAETVVNGLINNGDALLVSRYVKISPKGIKTLYTGAGSSRRLEILKEILSSKRIFALNTMLRKRYKGFWGEVA